MPSQVLQDLSRFGPSHGEPCSHDQALDYVRDLTNRSNENFHVLSQFLPARLHDDFCAVYAFCRWADDLGDETGDRAQAMTLLEWWHRELEECFAGRATHPVYIALAATIARHHLPMAPFSDLIDAFKQDQNVTRYESWEQLLDYCRRSANPVGRLILMMTGRPDAESLARSDDTCTALQLVNFWQDVRRDILERDRVYIPADIANIHGLDLGSLAATIRDNRAMDDSTQKAYRATIADLIDRTSPLFVKGHRLWPMVNREIFPVIQLFTLGGEAILRKIVKLGYDTATARPRLTKLEKIWILLRVWTARRFGLRSRETAAPERFETKGAQMHADKRP